MDSVKKPENPPEPEPFKLKSKHNESRFYDEVVIGKERKARVIPNAEMIEFLDSKGPMFKAIWMKKFSKGMTLNYLKYITALMKGAKIKNGTLKTETDNRNSASEPGSPQGDRTDGVQGDEGNGEDVQVHTGSCEVRSSSECGSAPCPGSDESSCSSEKV